jgi:hypothetical protein
MFLASMITTMIGKKKRLRKNKRLRKKKRLRLRRWPRKTHKEA